MKPLTLHSFILRLLNQKIPSTIELISLLVFSSKMSSCSNFFSLDFMVHSLIHLIKTELA